MKNALLVPGVFFLNFFFALLFFSFFSGLALRYGLTVQEDDAGFFLFLCIMQRACYVLPAVTVMAIISVYNFFMRHRVKLSVGISLFIVCLLLIIFVLIPVCYAQIASIERLVGAYQVQPTNDTVLNGFIDKPSFLASLVHDFDILFTDLYNAYSIGFTNYLFLAFAVFICICSLWSICIATRWNMINLLLLFVFARLFFLLYTSMHHEVFQSILTNINLDLESSSIGIPIVLIVFAIIVHSYGGIKLLIRSLKPKRKGELHNA